LRKARRPPIGLKRQNRPSPTPETRPNSRTRAWRNLAHELDRTQLHTYDTGAGTVSQRTRRTSKQRDILEALELPEPPRYYQFEPLND
jgi:hypothetical protein